VLKPQTAPIASYPERIDAARAWPSSSSSALPAIGWPADKAAARRELPQNDRDCDRDVVPSPERIGGSCTGLRALTLCATTPPRTPRCRGLNGEQSPSARQVYFRSTPMNCGRPHGHRPGRRELFLTAMPPARGPRQQLHERNLERRNVSGSAQLRAGRTRRREARSSITRRHGIGGVLGSGQPAWWSG